ncbi:MAG: tetratricopeptide repeat protein [Rhodobacteraceae bacterium]|nr:tetratricopeptide repeat protein [Paracoccaceae bacterium]
MTDTGEQPRRFGSLGEMRQAAIDAHQKGDTARARDLYRRYLSGAPKDSVIWSNLGVLFRKTKNYEMAAACQRRALHVAPNALAVLNNASNAFFDTGYAEEALSLRRRAIAMEPGNMDHYACLGKYLRALNRYDEARAELEKALRVAPDNVELHLQLSFVLLSLGDYAGGFKEFEWRWQGNEISPPEFDFPQWRGEDVAGKTLVVVPEQGFGDTVLMARFLGGLADRGCKIKWVCKPPLRRIFSALPMIDSFVDTQDQVADCDLWTPMMDLPRYLGVTLQDVPPPVTLAIPADSVTRAENLTRPYGDMLKIGVLWSGSVTYRANHKRSFSHRHFLRLANIPGVQLFSLYKGSLVEAFHADGTACVILDAASMDRDFADSAALIQKLDLVITMDSAIAHISGSLGVKVWNILHSEAYWLYAPYPDHTPWYPCMRLIRQKDSGDWDSVFDLLEDEITALAQEKTP